MNRFIPGTLVISKAGRDKGRMFLVVEPADEQHVWLVDGKLRRIEKPKKKKIIHLQATKYHSDILNEQYVNNAQVWKMIQALYGKEEESEIG